MLERFTFSLPLANEKGDCDSALGALALGSPYATRSVQCTRFAGFEIPAKRANVIRWR